MTRLRAVIGQVNGDGTIRPVGILHPSICPGCHRRPVLVGETRCWDCRDEHRDRFSDEGGDPNE